MTDYTPPVDRPCVCTPTSPSQFDVLLKEYEGILATELQAGQAEYQARSTQADTASNAVCIERKINDKYNQAVKQYNFLSNCITVYSGQDLEELTKTITGKVKPKKGDVKAAFDKAVAAIKAAKQKIGQAATLSVKLKEAVADSCNSEELKQIRECLQKGHVDKSSPENRNLENSVQEFVQYGYHINDQIDNVAQAAVKVAGINSFVNVDSFEGLAITAKLAGTSLINDVEANVKDSLKKYDDSRKDLGDALKKLSTAMVNKYETANLIEAVEEVTAFVKEKNCHNDCHALDDIAEEAEATYDCSHCGGDDGTTD
ncbi:hypothetical protein [Chitinophaga nivalis]|uniref:Cell surface protein n=1 Tax=Chitinophaga nivalis TaxID=2991709 RepID=A0ABT3IP43_9BACT|nr:hypothetical protein [Chitinophaga nivalis]MCW3464563.1 hypothetical protein [Chitinophaga nivalis]MCW3485746.1 hypothetical protein [Chitinophaga nivalis]